MFNETDITQIVNATLVSRQNLNTALCIYQNFERIKNKVIISFLKNLETRLLHDIDFEGSEIVNNFHEKSISSYSKLQCKITIKQQIYSICIENQLNDLSHFYLGIRKAYEEQPIVDNFSNFLREKLGPKFQTGVNNWWIIAIKNFDKEPSYSFDKIEIISDMLGDDSMILEDIFGKMKHIKKRVDEFNNS